MWTPILWHLALRRDRGAIYELSTSYDFPGPIQDAFSQKGLAYRAYRMGDWMGANALAMDAFNRRDLTGYRYWLRRAANLGDPDCLAELRRFETRLPHKTAFAIRRGRPLRRNVNYE